jgi:hypothetical protein
MQLYPRLVGFGLDGKAIDAGFRASTYEAPIQKVMMLPSDHYDFIGCVDVKGKTEQEIVSEVARVI